MTKSIYDDLKKIPYYDMASFEYLFHVVREAVGENYPKGYCFTKGATNGKFGKGRDSDSSTGIKDFAFLLAPETMPVPVRKKKESPPVPAQEEKKKESPRPFYIAGYEKFVTPFQKILNGNGKSDLFMSKLEEYYREKPLCRYLEIMLNLVCVFDQEDVSNGIADVISGENTLIRFPFFSDKESTFLKCLQRKSFLPFDSDWKNLYRLLSVCPLANNSIKKNLYTIESESTPESCKGVDFFALAEAIGWTEVESTPEIISCFPVPAPDGSKQCKWNAWNKLLNLKRENLQTLGLTAYLLYHGILHLRQNALVRFRDTLYMEALTIKESNPHRAKLMQLSADLGHREAAQHYAQSVFERDALAGLKYFLKALDCGSSNNNNDEITRVALWEIAFRLQSGDFDKNTIDNEILKNKEISGLLTEATLKLNDPNIGIQSLSDVIIFPCNDEGGTAKSSMNNYVGRKLAYEIYLAQAIVCPFSKAYNSLGSAMISQNPARKIELKDIYRNAVIRLTIPAWEQRIEGENPSEINQKIGIAFLSVAMESGNLNAGINLGRYYEKRGSGVSEEIPVRRREMMIFCARLEEPVAKEWVCSEAEKSLPNKK